ncbi:MAG: hypothetical protein NTX03_08840 [Bacteroidetes bacterium]|nr:hypothetical protein [Bacteroidota bacterium]
MEDLNKTIKKLSEPDYKALIQHIGDRKESKPYQVLEAARTQNFDDNKIMAQLDVNASTYYTLKSRLKDKVAAYLSKQVDNPIGELLEEVVRVPANLYGTSRESSIRALRDLEKQLLGYDMSSDLVTVYKTLARLNLFNFDFEYYNKLYNKYVAYSLALVKAENHFYEFIPKTGNYLLARNEYDIETLWTVIRQVENIRDMYESHRLYVLYNIIKIYLLCIAPEDTEGLRRKEMEIHSTLKEIQSIFLKYNLDTFYQNNKHIVDLLYFEYYTRTSNAIRAEHYYEKAAASILDLSQKHIMNFNVICFLNSKIGLYLLTKDEKYLTHLNEDLETALDINPEETYHYASSKMYFAICKFYEGDHARAAKLVNNFRNEVSLRNYLYTDVQCKLFQCLQYAFMGDEELAIQLINSVKRQLADQHDEIPNIKVFLKLLTYAIKPGEYKKKLVKLTQLWQKFQDTNYGSFRMLEYVQLDEKLLKKLAEPFKMKV